ncbi:hypothetical protein ACXR2W_00915 [Leucobacter sp. HY1908]
MDAIGANILLTRLRLLDPRFPVADDPVAQAEVWADVLHDVALEDALKAAVAHYRESSLRLMPADLVARCPAVDVVDPVARERAEWLAARGLSEAELARMGRGELERLVSGG